MLPRAFGTVRLAAGRPVLITSSHLTRHLTTATTTALLSSHTHRPRHHRSHLTHPTTPPTTHTPRRSIQQPKQPQQQQSKPATAGHGPEWTTSTRGSPDTETFRLYFHRADSPSTPLSPWHHIPLLSTHSDSDSDSSSAGASGGGRLYHYVNEIPRGTTAKMEVSTTTPHNPIAQDIKKGKLRHFTYGSIPFNYGCLPQTWEDPSATHPATRCRGDNDPLDVVELSATPLPIGSVHTVRIVGVLALIDEGETDWKLLAVRRGDALWGAVRSVADVERAVPGLVERVKEWFKHYKTTDGKAVNVLGFDERVLGVEEAEEVIRETHQAWKELVEGKKEPAGLWLRDGKVEGVPESKP